MGQYYLLANVLKKQYMKPLMMKACEIMGGQDFQGQLALLLLQLDCEKSLENSCLKFLAQHDCEYPEGAVETLPKHLQQKMSITKLRELHVGEWAGDRLIITGDYSDHSPFPPDGKWRAGNLFEMIESSFSDAPYVDIPTVANKMWLSEYFRRGYKAKEPKKEENKEALDVLKWLCEDRLHFIVNLDLKEYLDPRDYPANEKNVVDFAEKRTGAMAGLVIKLIHSTEGGGGDLPSSITSQGSWAGCRIKICDAEEVDESFKNTSNANEVKELFRVDSESD